MTVRSTRAQLTATLPLYTLAPRPRGGGTAFVFTCRSTLGYSRCTSFRLARTACTTALAACTIENRRLQSDSFLPAGGIAWNVRLTGTQQRTPEDGIQGHVGRAMSGSLILKCARSMSRSATDTVLRPAKSEPRELLPTSPFEAKLACLRVQYPMTQEQTASQQRCQDAAQNEPEGMGGGGQI